MNKSAIGFSALGIFFTCAAVQATLCEKCRELMFITNIGTCVDCGGQTSSGAHKLCRICSKRIGECQHCRVKLPQGKDVSPPDSGDPSRVVVCRDDANGSTVKAEVGDAVAIELPGNQTTGYRWQVTAIRGKAVRQRGGIEYRAVSVQKGRVGTGGTFRLVFETVSPGASTVSLAYQRPWEKDGVPAREFSVTIDVAAD